MHLKRRCSLQPYFAFNHLIWVLCVSFVPTHVLYGNLWLGSFFFICQPACCLTVQVLFCFILFLIWKKPTNLILPGVRKPIDIHTLTLRGLLRSFPQQVQSKWAGWTVPLLQATWVYHELNWRVWNCCGIHLGDWKPLQGWPFSSNAPFEIMETPLRGKLVGTAWWKQGCCCL